jgi:hypothetical protein
MGPVNSCFTDFRLPLFTVSYPPLSKSWPLLIAIGAPAIGHPVSEWLLARRKTNPEMTVRKPSTAPGLFCDCNQPQSLAPTRYAPPGAKQTRIWWKTFSKGSFSSSGNEPRRKWEVEDQSAAGRSKDPQSLACQYSGFLRDQQVLSEGRSREATLALAPFLSRCAWRHRSRGPRFPLETDSRNAESSGATGNEE